MTKWIGTSSLIHLGELTGLKTNGPKGWYITFCVVYLQVSPNPRVKPTIIMICHCSVRRVDGRCLLMDVRLQARINRLGRLVITVIAADGFDWLKRISFINHDEVVARAKQVLQDVIQGV